jgi:tetratricopeptide (TPR) repeat protein
MLISSHGTWLVGLATFISVAVAQGAETLSGSGVVISAKGEILTNAHVVNACQTITVTLASRHSELGTLVVQDERNDLAVIHLTGANNPPTSVALFREGSPVRAGDAIVALGYPLTGLLATDANVSVGNVSALAGIADDSCYFQISAPVQPGNSGGPLLDASGHLVGIVTAKLNALRVARFTGDIPENVNFALKTDVARTFLDSKHIGYQTARSGQQQLSPADIGDLARSFTVHIECEHADAQSTATAEISGPPPPIQTSPSKEIGWCIAPDNLPDDIIKGCTAVLQMSRSAMAFKNRGLAYDHKGDYKHAISDFTEAIQLHPDCQAFYFRGLAYRSKRQYGHAMRDFVAAVEAASC